MVDAANANATAQEPAETTEPLWAALKPLMADGEEVLWCHQPRRRVPALNVALMGLALGLVAVQMTWRHGWLAGLGCLLPFGLILAVGAPLSRRYDRRRIQAITDRRVLMATVNGLLDWALDVDRIVWWEIARRRDGADIVLPLGRSRLQGSRRLDGVRNPAAVNRLLCELTAGTGARPAEPAAKS